VRTDFPAGLLANLRSETPTLALCWRVLKNDNSQIYGTDHDVDLTLTGGAKAGTYDARSNITGSGLRSSPDLSVDNMEVGGAFATDLGTSPPQVTLDVNVHDIEAGLFQGASVYVYLVNWQAPATDAVLWRRGYLGEISRDSDGKYSAEMRGITQLLQQVFVRTYGERCEVDTFGDSECKVDVAALQRVGIVSAVTNRRRFNTTITVDNSEHVENDGEWFSLGEITFTSGDNIGITREIRSDFEDSTFGHLSTWDTFPYDIQSGDHFTIRPGCDRLPTTCRQKYDNLLNFRGYGIFVQGIDAMLAGPVGPS
jgi:uncharacterized phage protein (TIGR02218 family)